MSDKDLMTGKIDDEMMLEVNGGQGLVSKILSDVALFKVGDMVFRKTNLKDKGVIRKVHVNQQDPLASHYDVSFSKEYWTDVPHDSLRKA